MQRLLQVKEEASKQEFFRQESVKRLNLARGDLKNTLDACHKTMEVSAKCLTSYFRNIPTTQLSKEIAERFEHFDKDKNGTLDKEEVREAMAEMGQRPNEGELETFFTACDTDCNGSIDLAEFEAMVRVKLGLEDMKNLLSVAASLRNLYRKKKSSRSLLPGLSRRKSCPDVIFQRKQLPPLKERKPSAGATPPARARRGSLTALERSVGRFRPDFLQTQLASPTDESRASLRSSMGGRAGRASPEPLARPSTSAGAAQQQEVQRRPATQDSRRRKSKEAAMVGSGWQDAAVQSAKVLRMRDVDASPLKGPGKGSPSSQKIKHRLAQEHEQADVVG
eukprot:3346504-Rhodomonas_salina.3